MQKIWESTEKYEAKLLINNKELHKIKELSKSYRVGFESGASANSTTPAISIQSSSEEL